MIRLALQSDIDTLANLDSQLFTSNWKVSHFEYEIKENPYSSIYVYVVDNEIVAYMGLWLIFEKAELTTLAVREDYQGLGLGELMLDYAIERAKESECMYLSLEVRVSNEVALNLYQKKGFEVVNIKKRYYQDNGEDAYYMIKSL